MRVGIISPNLNSNSGGVERFCTHLRAALESHGFECEIVVPNRIAGKWVRRLGVVPIKQGAEVSKALAGRGFDIVISNGTIGYLPGYDGWRVHVFHGTMLSSCWRDRSDRRLRDWLLAGVLGGGLAEMLSARRCTKICVSDSVREELQRFYRIRSDLVLPNAVEIRGDVDRAELRSELLYVGRRESRKGYEDAVEISASYGSKLRVAGPGYDARTVNLGVLAINGVREEYESAFALLFPTRYEACSYVLLEAIEARCPVITTPVGYMRDILNAVPEYAPLIIWPGEDPVRRALEILEWMANSPDLVRSAVESARRFAVRNNNLQEWARQWADVCVRFTETGE